MVSADTHMAGVGAPSCSVVHLSLPNVVEYPEDICRKYFIKALNSGEGERYFIKTSRTNTRHAGKQYIPSIRCLGSNKIHHRNVGSDHNDQQISIVPLASMNI